jgi:hypothetical protein
MSQTRANPVSIGRIRTDRSQPEARVSGSTVGHVPPLDVLLDVLESAAGPAAPLPSTDAWELVLAENVAYLVDDQRRGDAMGRLRRLVGIEPEQILAAPEDVLLQAVTGMQPAARVARLRRCAELAVAGAPWTPGIGKPGAERIALFTGTRAVLALDSNALRVLVRLGYGDPGSAYAPTYRQAQARASAQLTETVPARQRAHQLLRRHGQTICRRSAPACPRCPLAEHCPSAHATP